MQITTKLDKYLTEFPESGFLWDNANCCHFVGNWVQAATWINPMDGLRKTSTAFDAKRLIVEMGGSLEACWTKQMGQDPILPAFAQTGDIVLVPLPEDDAGVGICVGLNAICISTAGKLTRVDMARATHAWRVVSKSA